MFTSLSVHNTSKAELQREHEQKLDDLQQHATEAASELDRKLLRLNTLIKEKEVYLSKAQNLLSTRYDK
jgi:Mg2+ and Co2+ transporter CorA